MSHPDHKERRPDHNATRSLPSGFKLRCVGRLAIIGTQMLWNKVFVGSIWKEGDAWRALPASNCKTCNEPVCILLQSKKGMRCEKSEFVDGEWNHMVVWINKKNTFYQPTRDHAIQSLIPKGE